VVLGRTIRAQDVRLLSYGEVDVRMIVGRQRTNAIKGGDADLDAAHAHFVEKQGHLRKRGLSVCHGSKDLAHHPLPHLVFRVFLRH